MTTASRRRAREVALQVLYSLDVTPELAPDAALATYFDRFAREAQEVVAEDQGRADRPEEAGDDDEDDVKGGRKILERLDRPFLEALVRGVTERRAELDERLGQLSKNWRVERIARVERTILRIALYELEHRGDVPARVTLNEAIELAKAYGAADAPAFVNGLLDSAMHASGAHKE
jgi:N utilization substance protein B